MEPIIEYTNYRPGYDMEGVSRDRAFLEYRLKFPAHVSDETHEEIQAALAQLEHIVIKFNNPKGEPDETLPSYPVED